MVRTNRHANQTAFTVVVDRCAGVVPIIADLDGAIWTEGAAVPPTSIAAVGLDDGRHGAPQPGLHFDAGRRSVSGGAKCAPTRTADRSTPAIHPRRTWQSGASTTEAPCEPVADRTPFAPRRDWLSSVAGATKASSSPSTRPASADDDTEQDTPRRRTGRAAAPRCRWSSSPELPGNRGSRSRRALRRRQVSAGSAALRSRTGARSTPARTPEAGAENSESSLTTTRSGRRMTPRSLIGRRSGAHIGEDRSSAALRAVARRILDLGPLP